MGAMVEVTFQAYRFLRAACKESKASNQELMIDPNRDRPDMMSDKAQIKGETGLISEI